MKDKELWILTAALGGLSVLGLALTHLALTDIWHGREPDLTAEWAVVRISLLIFAGFIASAGGLACRVYRDLRRKPNG